MTEDGEIQINTICVKDRKVNRTVIVSSLDRERERERLDSDCSGGEINL